MAALTLTALQSQFMTALEQPFLDAFGDGVILPGGNPTVIEGFEGFKDQNAEAKERALNGIKSSFAPLISKLIPLNTPTPPAYVTVTVFENGFSVWGDGNYGNGVVRYYKDSQDLIHVHGLMRTPVSGSTIGIVAWTLPAGFRPAPGDNRIYAQVADNNYCCVEVNSAGQVSLRSSPANNTWVSLELSFYAGG